MKTRIIAFICMGVMALPLYSIAQSNSDFEDDVYFTPKKEVKTVTTKKVGGTEKILISNQSGSKVSALRERDVDEYNRRVEEPVDVEGEYDSLQAYEEEESYEAKINRFNEDDLGQRINDPEYTNVYVFNSDDEFTLVRDNGNTYIYNSPRTAWDIYFWGPNYYYTPFYASYGWYSPRWGFSLGWGSPYWNSYGWYGYGWDYGWGGYYDPYYPYYGGSYYHHGWNDRHDRYRPLYSSQGRTTSYGSNRGTSRRSSDRSGLASRDSRSGSADNQISSRSSRTASSANQNGRIISSSTTTSRSTRIASSQSTNSGRSTSDVQSVGRAGSDRAGTIVRSSEINGSSRSTRSNSTVIPSTSSRSSSVSSPTTSGRSSAVSTPSTSGRSSSYSTPSSSSRSSSYSTPSSSSRSSSVSSGSSSGRSSGGSSGGGSSRGGRR